MNCFSFLLLLILCINKLVNATNEEIAFLDLHTNNQVIGDAIIIRSGNEYAMIDVGYGTNVTKNKKVSFEKVQSYFNSNHITKLKWVLLTHNHEDHVGGILDLVKMKVKNKNNKQVNLKIEDGVYTKNYSGLESNCGESEFKSVDDYRKDRKKNWNDRIKQIKEKTDVNIITSNTSLELGKFKFKLYNTNNVFSGYGNACKNLCKNCNCDSNIGCNENTNSVIAVAEYGNVHYFFSGDIQRYPNGKGDEYKPFKDAYKNFGIEYWINESKKDFNIDHFDVFKASHHGIGKNNYEKVYNAAKPEICVITTKYRSTENQNEVINHIKSGNQTAEIYYTGAGTVKIIQKNKNAIQRPLKIYDDRHNEIKRCSNNKQCPDIKENNKVIHQCCFIYGGYCVPNSSTHCYKN
ncbi:hypothetical protein BCR32DRAFT_295178 [Anaeromyces robustus]|uniref:Metallo-beta-lactamase domain-containing protein n=1 Tax=Anaeromyces robustus TaxID=1754192 RepID=A0A1Y1WXZ1_9FUNG|nr:hypothetical protein BCR32DRAFT_295178 [Anaeromyces robustus]|eukprot:ORX78188.1 hypothetical protein BCR32DRAFT_295178 [Anaeromyces robustus]